MRLLDLFCCAGGAARGYADAGFEVVGVDFKPQPRYPFEFIQTDVLGLSADYLASFDAIHASPPCQANSALNTIPRVKAKGHVDLIPQTRALLIASGRPWIMENVVGARLIDPILLCGTMFGLGVADADLRRHRLFEANFPLRGIPRCHHGRRSTIGVYGGHIRNRSRTIGVYGKGCEDRDRRNPNGRAPNFTIAQGREAMGIDWMTQTELSQAIPPAYTRFLGEHLRAYVGLL